MYELNSTVSSSNIGYNNMLLIPWAVTMVSAVVFNYLRRPQQAIVEESTKIEALQLKYELMAEKNRLHLQINELEEDSNYLYMRQLETGFFESNDASRATTSMELDSQLKQLNTYDASINTREWSQLSAQEAKLFDDIEDQTHVLKDHLEKNTANHELSMHVLEQQETQILSKELELRNLRAQLGLSPSHRPFFDSRSHSKQSDSGSDEINHNDIKPNAQ